jgi:hypothetical protein
VNGDVLVVALWVFAIVASVHAGIRGRHGWATGVVVFLCCIGFRSGWVIVPIGAVVWVVIAAFRWRRSVNA